MNSNKKGFTLIELLIVIGILAVLATITVLVLNPAELFKQARDSQRISDVGSIKGALSLYLTTVSSPDLDGALDCATDCFTNVAGVGANCGGRHAAARVLTVDTDRTTDGNGWIPVVLDDTTGGSPLSVLPIDPAQSTTLFYSYACSGTTFELNANMESARYASGGSDDVESTDGGHDGGAATTVVADTVYEVGIDPGLDL